MRKPGSRGRTESLRRIGEGLRHAGESFLHLCFPRACAGCQKAWLGPRQGHWCDACLENLPWVRSPLCPLCGRPFTKSAPSADHLCGDCLLVSPPFHSARSAAHHSGIVRDRIHQLKFGGKLQWVPPLADLLVRTFRMDPPAQVHWIAPVPLHVKRLRQRGFNQSALIARVLGRRLCIPVRVDVLVRQNWTEPQTRLSREERLHNVRGAFSVTQASVVSGFTVLLIDDVFTTGTTVSECAKTLKRAGAAEVRVLTVSRAVPDWKAD